MILQTDIFRRVVRDEMRPPPVLIPPGTTIGQAVKRMADDATSSAVVVDGSGRPRGIITEQDVVRRIVWRMSPDQEIETVMSSPVATVGAEDHLFNAIALMRRRRLRHIPVVDQTGSIAGMLALDDALGFLSGQTLSIIEQLTHEESVYGLKRIKQAQVELAAALFHDNAPAPEVQLLLTEINNDIHRRVLRLMIAKLVEDGWGEFIDQHAAFLVQKGIYEYARARAGHYAKVLFREPAFLESVEVARWRAYPLGLAMVGELVEGALRPFVGEDRRAALDALSALILEVFDRYPAPAALGAREWSELRQELVRQLGLIGTHRPKLVKDIPERFAKEYFALMPIHEKLRGRDYPTIRNYLRVTMCNIHDLLTKRMDPRPMAALLRRSAAAPEAGL